MSKQQFSEKRETRIKIYDYDKIISRNFALMEKDLSENNVKLIKKFDMILVNESLSEARRSKILNTLLSLSRLLNKDWSETTYPHLPQNCSPVTPSVNREFFPQRKQLESFAKVTMKVALCCHLFYCNFSWRNTLIRTLVL